MGRIVLHHDDRGAQGARETGRRRAGHPVKVFRSAPASLFVLAALILLGSCRSLRPGPDRGSEPRPQDPEPAPPAARADEPPEAVSDTVAAAVAAIIDSVRAEVRDSIEAEATRGSRERTARDSARAAAVRDSLRAAFVADSVWAAFVRDSLRTVAVQDSLRAVAIRDSIATAVRDSIAAAAVRDSVEAARRDSLAEVAAREAAEAAARDSALAGSEATARAAAVSEDAEELRKLGPIYIPYDQGPRPVWTTEAQALLTRTLVPVLREEGLPARTRAMLWILIRRDGTVADLVLQTSSGNRAFDEAATRFAQMLEFVPAIRANRPVATWVLREISILMQ